MPRSRCPKSSTLRGHRYHGTRHSSVLQVSQEVTRPKVGLIRARPGPIDHSAISLVNADLLSFEPKKHLLPSAQYRTLSFSKNYLGLLRQFPAE